MNLKIVLFLLLISTILSCVNTTYSSASTRQNQWVIDSLSTGGYVLNGEANFPEGISDSLIRGYTDRVNGIYHLKELKVTSLEITSLKFEKKETSWTRQIYYYQFSFKDKKEEVQFVRFQKLIQNYQTHSKNQVTFFRQNKSWYLEFIPMP